MIIKVIDAPAVPGGKAFALCDEQGDMLPMQQRAVVDVGIGDMGTITVTFAIDGELVRIED